MGVRSKNIDPKSRARRRDAGTSKSRANSEILGFFWPSIEAKALTMRFSVSLYASAWLWLMLVENRKECYVGIGFYVRIGSTNTRSGWGDCIRALLQPKVHNSM